MASSGAATGEKPFAYCTLVTNDAYVPAALVVAKSLRNTNTPHRLAVLATTGTVSDESETKLKTLFDDVIRVDTISGLSTANLSMIGRPDLHATLTKFHLWSLTQFSRVLYLDADTLVLRSLDHLFASIPPSVDFAASPELGFPDCFNAGFMFLTPEKGTYDELRAFGQTHDSFDGGDQGILNVFFGDGTVGHPMREFVAATAGVDGGAATSSPPRRNWYRLSYTYNMEMHRVYRMYISAVLRYRGEHTVLHFIGKDKPWHFPDGAVPSDGDDSAYFKFYAEMVGKWWEVSRSLADI